ncbi:hypothetical protein LOAG_09896 [Loa loa]|uniref:Activin_recp domain-containing protein n=1 Tax=Loa loa TaxID=7209 RepID=A0A1I7VZR1_LOALO|nr:hypothetical protein LOAG_09896 [Loa loa]EFO18597.2 hypothetical protein LOAG_09896 [Loa loa]
MVDATHAGTTFPDKSAFTFIIVAFVVPTTVAIKCQIYFRRGKSTPKTNETEDCESSSCCFTAELHHNRHIYQMKGCDADNVQDDMLVYVPSLTGRPWENIMEACLASECRVHSDLLGGKGQSYLCGCDIDYCNEKSFQATFPQLRNIPNDDTTSRASMLNNNLLWIMGGSASIMRKLRIF